MEEIGEQNGGENLTKIGNENATNDVDVSSDDFKSNDNKKDDVASTIDDGSDDEHMSNAEGESDVEMEDNVIHFLAEKSVTKTSVKTGIKSACRFKCHDCTSIFRYKSTLNYHLKSECGRKVIKGKTLVEKQPQGKVSCNICSKTLCSRTSLMVHMRIHTGERPFTCGQCDRSFFQKAHLQDHEAKMHTSGCVLCRLCNAIFDDKYHLTLHMKTHKQIVSPFDCKLCDESFSSRTSLSNHMTMKHSNDSTDLPVKTPRSGRTHVDPNETECSECGKTYSGAKQLRAHIRRSHRASLPCPHCPRLFPSGYDLRVHSRCHTGERPYSCEFCERTFSRKSILDVHRTLHTGQKDFVCSVCNKAFNRKSKLQVHETEHTNTMVKCQICDKEFKCQSYLSSHMKIHLQEQIDVKPTLKKSIKRKSTKRAVPDLKPIRLLRNRIKQEPTEVSSDSSDSVMSSDNTLSMYSASSNLTSDASADSTCKVRLKGDALSSSVSMKPQLTKSIKPSPTHLQENESKSTKLTLKPTESLIKPLETPTQPTKVLPEFTKTSESSEPKILSSVTDNLSINPLDIVKVEFFEETNIPLDFSVKSH